MRPMLIIDGSQGEGGGQILRSSLTLATILTQPITIENIRAKRKTPGLAAQHLTAVRAAAQICAATVSGAELGSTRLTFIPQSQPIAGDYYFNVAEARMGGSAGAATLVIQTILLPLVLAQGKSRVIVEGGTHVEWSPSYHYLHNTFLPMLAYLGVTVQAELLAWGWYPAGQGKIELNIPGSAELKLNNVSRWTQRGRLKQIHGLGVAANIAAHIAQRLVDQAKRLLEPLAVPLVIEPQRVKSVSPGAGIFLVAEYESSYAGFSALGRIGKSSEQVAEAAVHELLRFHRSAGVLEPHLTDQLILPLALTRQAITVSSESLSLHTMTNIAVISQFLGPVIQVDEANQLIHFRPS